MNALENGSRGTGKIRIGISTRGLNQGSFAISTIIYHLTAAILEAVQADDRIEVILYFNDPSYAALFDGDVQTRSRRITNRFLWDHFWLPHALERDGIDIALFMKGTMPFGLACEAAVIFNDMGYFREDIKPYKYFETIYMKWMLARTARRASRLFAISQYTRDDIVRILHIDPARISVFYPDCSSLYRPVSDPRSLEAVRAAYDLPEVFIFNPSSISPSKNQGRLLDAFEKVLDQIPHHLVITGGRTWRSNRLLGRIASGFKHRVRVIGNVPIEHMPALYSLAAFTVYPSLLEGFGIPILESFRCGCPVMTSNLASMPEVAGGAAYLVDPYSVDQIREGMYRLATDETLRRELASKGFERARVFNWQTAARQVLDEMLLAARDLA
jgi:glycosyltransferase involved in cell wall biosynthesis